MYALSNISYEEYKQSCINYHGTKWQMRIANLLLSVDEILRKSEDSIFIWDCDFSKFETEFKGCICDPTIGGQWVSYYNGLPFNLSKRSDSVILMTVVTHFPERDDVEEYELHIPSSILDQSVNTEEFHTILKEIYILKLEKTFRKQSKDHRELKLKDKHVKEFFRSILGGE
jgi:hypothetical protein